MKTSQLQAITYYAPFMVYERTGTKSYRVIVAEVAMYADTNQEERHDRIRMRAAELSKNYGCEVRDFDHWNVSTNIADVLKAYSYARLS